MRRDPAHDLDLPAIVANPDYAAASRDFRGRHAEVFVRHPVQPVPILRDQAPPIVGHIEVRGDPVSTLGDTPENPPNWTLDCPGCR